MTREVLTDDRKLLGRPGDDEVVRPNTGERWQVRGPETSNDLAGFRNNLVEVELRPNLDKAFPVGWQVADLRMRREPRRNIRRAVHQVVVEQQLLRSAFNKTVSAAGSKRRRNLPRILRVEDCAVFPTEQVEPCVAAGLLGGLGARCESRREDEGANVLLFIYSPECNYRT